MNTTTATVLWICPESDCYRTWRGPRTWQPICNDHLVPMKFVLDPVKEAEMILGDQMNDATGSLKRAHESRLIALSVVDKMDREMLGAITQCLENKMSWQQMADVIGINKGLLWTYYQRRLRKTAN